MAKIDHAAVRTSSYEDAQKFFEDVFEMHMWREIGEKPARKCWYKEGIQLCEVENVNTDGQQRLRSHLHRSRLCRGNNGEDQSISNHRHQ